jgi:alpha-beta hydrolase superfamily lysophospholipase
VNGSRQLDARSPSPDKTLREYEQGYHELFNDAERDAFASEILQWLDARSSRTA